MATRSSPLSAVDADSARRAGEVLAEFREPDGKVTLSRERADNLEMKICEALHDLRRS